MSTIDLDAGPDQLAEACAVMHAAFAQFAETGRPSGALLETPQTLAAERSDGVRVAVLRLDGRVVAMVKHAPAADESLYFSRLAVLPDARGTGLSTRLLRALREHAHAEGLSGLSCAVRADETGLISLYEHLGMRITRRSDKPSLTGAVIPVVWMRDAPTSPS